MRNKITKTYDGRENTLTGRFLLYVDTRYQWERCVAACTSSEALEAARRLIMLNNEDKE